MKKKLMVLVMSIAFVGLAMTFPTSAMAIEGPVQSEVNTTQVARASSSFTLTSKSAGNIWQVRLGANPTMRITATGNSQMTFKITVKNLGGAYDLGYIRADGSTITKKLNGGQAGLYYIYILPYSGTAGGEDYNFHFDVTW